MEETFADLVESLIGGASRLKSVPSPGNLVFISAPGTLQVLKLMSLAVIVHKLSPTLVYLFLLTKGEKNYLR